MLWKLDGVALEDIVPMPKAQPGRHFTSGHRILGSLTSTLDAKYAQMTYGDHYRKKVEAALERERQRCDDLLAEQKKKASAQKTLTPLKKTPVSSRIRSKPRYDLNELRHHQRRCAALLFGAREQRAHRLPVLVQWEPKRRESYYLMSERVYNDRVLMKMRADAGNSPLNFDFSNTDGETDDLLEFQKFINKTSKDIKGLSFDTQYNDYDYDFKEDEGGNMLQVEGAKVTRGENVQDGKTSDTKKGRRKVVFSDHVTESDTDAIDAKSRARPKQKERRRLNEGLDPSDIDLSFDSEDEIPDGEHRSTSERGRGSGPELESKKRRSKNSRKGLSSPDLLSLLQGTSRDEYSSDFESEGEDNLEGLSGNVEMDYLPSGDHGKKLHKNKHCKHSLKQKRQEYYNKLPKLLKTAELRAKLPLKSRETSSDQLGNDVNHHCMVPHKVAYDRALTLARFRTLPFSHSFLSRKINGMNSFSYFSALPGIEKVSEPEENDDNNLKKKKKVVEPAPSGREAIFGEIDMDDFYTKEDELIYFINPEELKNVVASTTTGAESSRNEDDISSRSATTYTSRSNTVKPYSGLESENEL